MGERLTNKVLLIGWDAADWKIISPLVDAGEMPNLARLVNRGVMGNLSTLQPVLSPMLWTSIATGKRAHKHGIHGFSEPDPHNGGVRPVTNLGRKTKAIWNILNQQGMRSNVIGWWPSNPVEPINGVMVSDHYHKIETRPDGSWPMRPGTVHPQRLIEPLKELRIHPSELEPEQVLPFVPQLAKAMQQEDERLHHVFKNLAECASVHAAATAVMSSEPWDFTAVYFDTIDHFCHGFMKYHPPRLPWVSEEDFELYKDVVNSAYRFHDLMLGTYMAMAGEDTTIILVSDHGFHPDHLRPMELPNEPAGAAEEHRQFGVFAAMGPGIRQDELAFGASLIDITPTILGLFGLPLGRDMDGKPLVSIFDRPVEVEYIDSWDSVPGDAGTHPADMQVAPVDQQEALQQLADLGYIDEPDTDQSVAVQNTIKELRYNLARDLIDSKHYVEALPLLDELWQQSPDESRFGVQRMECYLSLGRPGPARETFERLQRQKAEYAVKAAQDLEALQQQHKDKDPQDIPTPVRRRMAKLQRMTATNPHTIAFLEGRLLEAEGRHAEAYEQYKGALKVQVHNRPSLFLRLGEMCLALNQWQEAEQWFKRILQIDPVNPMPHIGLARACLSQRMNKRALQEAKLAVGLAFHNPMAHYLCGTALHRLGRIADAVKALQTALAQNPVFPLAHERLAHIYSKRLFDQHKAAEHRRLGRESQRRIRDFMQGKELPTPASAAMTEARLASMADLSTSDAMPPLGQDEMVIVSGLPRSGTSMMMQMLDAAGIQVLSDGERDADESNPRGYFEHEKVKQLARDNSWLSDSDGTALKVIAQLLPSLPMSRRYRVIFMERDLREILASQRAMLERLGKQGAKSAGDKLADTYMRHIETVRTILKRHTDQVSVLSINYGEATGDPAAVAAKVNSFLGGALDESAMARRVSPALHNQRHA